MYDDAIYTAFRSDIIIRVIWNTHLPAWFRRNWKLMYFHGASAWAWQTRHGWSSKCLQFVSHFSRLPPFALRKIIPKDRSIFVSGLLLQMDNNGVQYRRRRRRVGRQRNRGENGKWIRPKWKMNPSASSFPALGRTRDRDRGNKVNSGLSGKSRFLLAAGYSVREIHVIPRRSFKSSVASSFKTTMPLMEVSA